MDLLKRELERKKKKLAEAAAAAAAEQSAGGGSGGGAGRQPQRRRYVKANELRRLEEREAEEQEARHRQKQHEKGSAGGKSAAAVSSQEEGEEAPAKKKQRRSRDDDDDGRRENSSSSSSPPTAEKEGEGKATGDSSAGLADASNTTTPTTTTSASVTNRLRSMGLPVRLFGEGDAGRRRRLDRALADEKLQLATLSEKDEFLLGQGHRTRNTFLEQDNRNEMLGDGVDGRNPSAAAAASSKKSKDSSSPDGKKKKQTMEDFDLKNESDPYRRIYKYLKFLLKQWEDDLVQRPLDVKQSLAGKNETKTFQQCKDYIRPLFRLCKKRAVEESQVSHLTRIVDFCLEGEFVKAHDAYLDVAIGRAAWPMGVTMVGIHARTGRAKIESNNISHVMNTEACRKYLTSVKRLMNYAQKKRTDVDPSKKVMN